MDVDVYIILMLRALRVGEMGLDELGERVARPEVLDGGNPGQTSVSAQGNHRGLPLQVNLDID